MSTEYISQVHEGMNVYDASGEKIGEVGEVNIGLVQSELASGVADTEEQSYFQVRRGFLGFGDDLWVPADAIQSVSEDGITLLYSQDSDQFTGWSEPPRIQETGGPPAGDVLLGGSER